MNGKIAWVDLSKDDMNQLLISLIGYTFGNKPEEKLEEIRISRTNYARNFANLADVKKDDSVIDLGSGFGFAASYLAGICQHVKACDISKAYLEFASRGCDADNVEFMLLKDHRLEQIDDESIDKYLSMSVFIHFNIYDIYLNLQSAYRILKPGGKVVFDFANMDRLFTSDIQANDFFLNAIESYKVDSGNLFALMQWNSFTGIENVAKHIGFEFEQRKNDILVFNKS